MLIASRFRSSAYVRSPAGTASLTRLADLLALDISAHERIEILVDGSDETQAMAALTSYLENSNPH
nr:HPr family phosphocarrier protein [Acidipropionibacterium timonense]